jgi:hypothetical protein
MFFKDFDRMKLHFRTTHIAPCLAALLTAFAAGSCAGPAGVRPQLGHQTILRSCTIDQNMLTGKTDITVEAGRCPVLTLSGNPLTLQADQRLVISQAERMRIDGALTVAGAIELNQVRIDGPGQITFGSSELAPASVKITDSVIGTDESGNAPALALFGGGRADCSGTETNPYQFSGVTIEELAGHAIQLLQMPSSLSGLTFAASSDAPFTAQLGDLCIPTGREYALHAGGVRYEAGNLHVRGRLSLPGSHLVLNGTEGLVVDGGSLISTGAQDAVARIDFKPGAPLAGRRVTLRNRANGHLKHTHVSSGSVLVTNSGLVVSDSRISGACAAGDDPDCAKPENRAAVTVGEGGTLDLADSELLPKGETQVLVQDNGPTGSGRPQITTSGSADDYKVATMNGRPFHVSRVVPLLVGTHIDGRLRRALADLNGTYESPCMSSEQNENNSFRRVFTYDNVIEPHPSLPFIFASLRLRFVRTIINYEGAGCETPAYTSHMAGTATYYILRGEPDEQGRAPETLASRVWYDFNQLVWTYHNPNVIQTLNDQNFCEVSTWQVNVPQDVTHKKCFGDGFRFNGYHDRYELRSDGNLHLALDFDDRPDDLKDQIPALINKETVYVRK